MTDERSTVLRLGETCANGRYRVDRLLAVGGMAEIYEVWDLKDSAPRALKVLQVAHQHKEKIVQQMAAEGRALEEIRHQNLVRVFLTGIERDAIYFVMEMLDGVTLREAIHNSRGLPVVVALDWLAEIADAVHSLHELKIIHRDLKPENLFCARTPGTGDVVMKVLDLGAAKFERYALKSTTDGRTLGTGAYMSPEHVRGDKVDRRTDIYALGHIAYETFAGHHTFFTREEGMPTIGELTSWQLLREPLPLDQAAPRVPHVVAQIVGRCLEKDRERRFPNCMELARAFRAAKLYLREQGRLESPALVSAAIHAALGGRPRGASPTRMGVADTEEASAHQEREASVQPAAEVSGPHAGAGAQRAGQRGTLMMGDRSAFGLPAEPTSPPRAAPLPAAGQVAGRPYAPPPAEQAKTQAFPEGFSESLPAIVKAPHRPPVAPAAAPGAAQMAAAFPPAQPLGSPRSGPTHGDSFAAQRAYPPQQLTPLGVAIPRDGLQGPPPQSSLTVGKGIAVGVGLAAVLLLGTGGYLWSTRRAAQGVASPTISAASAAVSEAGQPPASAAPTDVTRVAVVADSASAAPLPASATPPSASAAVAPVPAAATAVAASSATPRAPTATARPSAATTSKRPASPSGQSRPPGGSAGLPPLPF